MWKNPNKADGEKYNWGHEPEGDSIDSWRMDGILKVKMGRKESHSRQRNNFRKRRRMKDDKVGKYWNTAIKQYGQSFGWETALGVNPVLGAKWKPDFEEFELKA